MATDTTPTPKVDLSTLYSPGQLDVLAQLREIQQASGMSDAAFVQRHLTVSATTWTRINSGTYGADPTSALLKLEGSLRQYRLERAHAAKLTGGTPFHSVPWQEAVAAAVTVAKLKGEEDCERLVVALAPQGAGKTRLLRQLKIQHDGILAEASEPWRGSYYAAVYDIGIAAGLSEADLGKSTATAQRALIRRLRANRRVLLIDEGEYLGQAATNLIKLILNQTPTTIVLATLPVLFDRWQSSAWAESLQVIRRAEAVLEAQPIFPEDVAAFASGRVKITINAREGWGMIAKAANEFGRFSLVERVLSVLHREGGEATLDDVVSTIRNTKALLRRREGN